MDARDVTVLEGGLDASLGRWLVLASRFNDAITERLASGAIGALAAAGARADHIVLAWVSGAWELPGAASQALRTGGWDGVIALGCLIRGETAHYDLIAGQVARGLGGLALAHGVPVSLGVLTVDTLEQAQQRAGGKYGNKGAEAALAAVSQAQILRALSSPPGEPAAEPRARGRRGSAR